MILLGKGLAIASLISGIIGVPLGISFGMKQAGVVDAKMGVSSILGIIAVGFNLGGVITTFIMK
jgi:ABC-type dipeptide/oligopeptide/nickel transport system permease component